MFFNINKNKIWVVKFYISIYRGKMYFEFENNVILGDVLWDYKIGEIGLR